MCISGAGPTVLCTVSFRMSVGPSATGSNRCGRLRHRISIYPRKRGSNSIESASRDGGEIQQESLASRDSRLSGHLYIVPPVSSTRFGDSANETKVFLTHRSSLQMRPTWRSFSLVTSRGQRNFCGRLSFCKFSWRTGPNLLYAKTCSQSDTDRADFHSMNFNSICTIACSCAVNKKSCEVWFTRTASLYA